VRSVSAKRGVPAALRTHLVTSPASFVSCMSPWRPTTACKRGERACGLGERLRRTPQRHRVRREPSAHHELVDVHGCVDGNLAAEVGLKLGLAHARLGVVRQQFGEALRKRVRVSGGVVHKERGARLCTWIPMATVMRQERVEVTGGSRHRMSRGRVQSREDKHLALPSAFRSTAAMVNKKSAFIDKRRAATYHLVASARGPDDEDGGGGGETAQRVFTRVAVRRAAQRLPRDCGADVAAYRLAQGEGQGVAELEEDDEAAARAQDEPCEADAYADYPAWMRPQPPLSAARCAELLEVRPRARCGGCAATDTRARPGRIAPRSWASLTTATTTCSTAAT